MGMEGRYNDSGDDYRPIACRNIGQHYVVENSTTKIKEAAMENQLESRIPLLDFS